MVYHPSFFLLKKLYAEIKLLKKRISREEFRIFVKTVEHNIRVKEKLVQCKTSKDLILLSKVIDTQ